MHIKFKTGKAIHGIRNQGCGWGSGRETARRLGGKGLPLLRACCLLALEWATWVAGMVRSLACCDRLAFRLKLRVERAGEQDLTGTGCSGLEAESV